MMNRIWQNWWAWVAAAVVVSSLGLGTTWSYLKTAWSQVGQTIRDVTPISFDLKRLEQMIRDLEPEIRRNMQVVAQLEVEVEYLEKGVRQLEREQEKAFAQMKQLREALREPRTEFEFGGRLFTRAQVERDLARRLDRYQMQQDRLEAKRQLLQQRLRTLQAAQEKVAEYRRQYDLLVAKAEQLKAELQLAQAAAATGELNLDGSKLGEARQLAQEVEARIRVLQKVIDQGRTPADEIPVATDARPASERFDELFGQQ